MLLQNKGACHYRGSHETQGIGNPNKEKSKGNSKDEGQREIPGWQLLNRPRDVSKQNRNKELKDSWYDLSSEKLVLTDRFL